jgi:hypothetical protein
LEKKHICNTCGLTKRCKIANEINFTSFVKKVTRNELLYVCTRVIRKPFFDTPRAKKTINSYPARFNYMNLENKVGDHMSESENVQIYNLVIGDCPKCKLRTFVVKEFVDKDMRGKCYNCNHTVELNF